MHYGTGIDSGGTAIYRSLGNGDGFWVVKRVVDGVEEKDPGDILI